MRRKLEKENLNVRCSDVLAILRKFNTMRLNWTQKMFWMNFWWTTRSYYEDSVQKLDVEYLDYNPEWRTELFLAWISRTKYWTSFGLMGKSVLKSLSEKYSQWTSQEERYKREIGLRLKGKNIFQRRKKSENLNLLEEEKEVKARKLYLLMSKQTCQEPRGGARQNLLISKKALRRCMQQKLQFDVRWGKIYLEIMQRIMQTGVK